MEDVTSNITAMRSKLRDPKISKNDRVEFHVSCFSSFKETVFAFIYELAVTANYLACPVNTKVPFNPN